MHTRNWLADFEFEPGALRVKKTGARIRVDRDIRRATFSWMRYFLAVAARHPRFGRPAFTIAFTPDRARPWYLIWAVARAAGGAVIDDPAQADVIVHFEDAIFGATPPPAACKPTARFINFGARDVSKTTVAQAFEQSFGYSLAVDPAAFDGEMVEKSEHNGVHDGRIVRGPLSRRTGCVYQRVVDNRGANGLVEDLRTVVVGDELGCVFVKRRPIERRFSNDNVSCSLLEPAAVFSAEEAARILRFARVLGLDWGGLDVLRDKGEGRVYIVDANKTDMGPPTALPFAEKMLATERLAQAFSRFLAKPDRG